MDVIKTPTERQGKEDKNRREEKTNGINEKNIRKGKK